MTKTAQVSVDNALPGTPVTAPIFCWKLYVREQGAAGTTDYYVRAPADADADFTKVAGETTTFVGPFQKDEVAGYLQTVSGTVTFSIITE